MAAKTISETIADAPDGRSVKIRFMDDGAIRLLTADGPWVVAQHRTGKEGTLLRLIRADTVPDE